MEAKVFDFELYEELYSKPVQMDDRFESVHIWDKAIAIRNKGRWIPELISIDKYNELKQNQ